jgi:hypothetical protein
MLASEPGVRAAREALRGKGGGASREWVEYASLRLGVDAWVEGLRRDREGVLGRECVSVVAEGMAALCEARLRALIFLWGGIRRGRVSFVYTPRLQPHLANRGATLDSDPSSLRRNSSRGLGGGLPSTNRNRNQKIGPKGKKSWPTIQKSTGVFFVVRLCCLRWCRRRWPTMALFCPVRRL